MSIDSPMKTWRENGTIILKVPHGAYRYTWAAHSVDALTAPEAIACTTDWTLSMAVTSSEMLLMLPEASSCSC